MKRERLIVLDALRAMAGLTVPLFHICENLGYPPLRYESVCGHGYLAVEFFLLLMGYMLAYAYDRRWSSGMGVWEFFRRRLVRPASSARHIRRSPRRARCLRAVRLRLFVDVVA